MAVFSNSQAVIPYLIRGCHSPLLASICVIVVNNVPN